MSDSSTSSHTYEPQGHILIEVDDLATHGNAVHDMAKLQKTFKFGKWKSIYNSDSAGRTVIQDQPYGFHVHQASLFRRDRPLL